MSPIDVNELNLCSVSMKQTILSYFVKVRIYWAVKYFNRSIVEKKLKKKKFSHV